MKKGQSYIQAYNCQTVALSAYQVIVAEAVTNHPADTHHLIPMLEQTASVSCELSRKHALPMPATYHQKIRAFTILDQ